MILPHNNKNQVFKVLIIHTLWLQFHIISPVLHTLGLQFHIINPVLPAHSCSESGLWRRLGGCLGSCRGAESGTGDGRLVEGADVGLPPPRQVHRQLRGEGHHTAGPAHPGGLTSTLSLWANSTSAYMALEKFAFFLRCFSMVTERMAPHFFE